MIKISKKILGISILSIVSIIIMLCVAGYLVFRSDYIIPKENFAERISSPNKTYEAEVYGLGDIGQLRVDIVNTNTKKSKLIYWSWKETFIDFKWIDDNNVYINGKYLNVAKDKYDKRRD